MEKKINKTQCGTQCSSKEKEKPHSVSGSFDIPGWSVWVLQGHRGGELGSEQLLRASGGQDAAGETNTTQNSINSNKQFPPAVTNPAQPWLGIKFHHLTWEDL